LISDIAEQRNDFEMKVFDIDPRKRAYKIVLLLETSVSTNVPG